MLEAPFTDLLVAIVDNRGRTCPTSSQGIPLIATNCVKNGALYPTYEKARWVDSETYETWFRGHPEPGDILFVCKGSPGTVALVPDPVDFCIAQDMVAVRADPDRVYPPFLFAALRSPQVQAQIAGMHVGTLIPHFKKGDFGELRIPLPDHQAQLFIGDLYIEMSQKIEANRRLIDLTWDLCTLEWRAIAAGAREIRPLGELVDANPDKAKPGAPQDIIRYIDIASVSPRRAEPAPMSWADAPSRARRQVRSGDLIFSTVRPNRRSFTLLVDPPENCVVSTGFAVLRGTGDVGPSAVAAIADDPVFADYLMSVSAGSAYPAVSSQAMLAYRTPVPSRDLLFGFEEQTMPLRVRAALAEREARKLTELRDALMLELLSSRLSVPSHGDAAGVLA
jgi:type I restriction enzyme S subunit